MSSILEIIQDDCADKLNSEDLFSTISVVAVRKLQIVSEIARRLPHLTVKNSKVGCGVLVGMPVIDVVDPNVPGPQLEVRLPFRVQENPTINQGSGGTQKSAEEVALNILKIVHQFQLAGFVGFYGDKGAITPNTEFEGLVTYDVTLTGRLGTTPLTKCAMPTIAEATLTITLACATSGAAIYYTADGTFPGSTNLVSNGGTAVLYTVPFAVTSGTVVRYAAFKTGLIGSDVGRAIIS